MSNERKIKTETEQNLRKIIVSLIVGIVAFVVVISVSAIIIANSNMDLENIKYFLLIALLIASFTASLFSAYSNRHMKGFISGLLTSLLLTFVVFVLIVTINGANLSTFAYILFSVCVIIGLPGGIIGANLKQ